MRFKTALTKTDLQRIQARAGNSDDIRALLWEIARLRSVVLYADQLQRIVPTLPGQQGLVLETLRRRLLDEPCVKEFPRLP